MNTLPILIFIIPLVSSHLHAESLDKESLLDGNHTHFLSAETPNDLLIRSALIPDLYTTDIIEELTQMLHEFLDGASRNDHEIHDRFWAEDLIYTSSAGLRFGKDTIMSGFSDENAEPGTAPSTIYTAEDIQIQVYDQMAIVAFKMRGETKTETGSEVQYYLNSGTFIKRDNRWRVVNWHATRTVQ
jgi:hypothetical protein